MAADEAILDAVIAGIAPPTLRLYRWESPAVTIGRFQSITRGIDLEACRVHSLPIVRRPTGGRGILHDEDQTISVALPLLNLGAAGRRVVDSYRILSEGIVRGLARLGVVVALGACERPKSRGGDCFASRSQADLLTLAGEKLIGSAQCRREGVILQQSSLRHQRPSLSVAQVFPESAEPESYSLEAVSLEELEEALIAGFQEALGGRWRVGSLTGWEEERAAWILGRRQG
jgi:lipoate-protein ligase A